jgi:hypothetical protein
MSESGTRSLINMDDDSEFVDPEVALQQLLDDPNLVQHIMRTASDGCETIAAYFRVVFEPGQQRQVLHIPFAPSLKVVPQVEAHVTDQQDVRVRITDQQKFGIRAEIVLPKQSESRRSLLVEFIVTDTD